MEIRKKRRLLSTDALCSPVPNKNIVSVPAPLPACCAAQPSPNLDLRPRSTPLLRLGRLSHRARRISTRGRIFAQGAQRDARARADGGDDDGGTAVDFATSAVARRRREAGAGQGRRRRARFRNLTLTVLLSFSLLSLYRRHPRTALKWPVEKPETLSASSVRPFTTLSPGSTPSTFTPRSTATASSTYVLPRLGAVQRVKQGS